MNVRFDTLRDNLRTGFLRPPRTRPYEAIAGMYDRIMDHVDYPAWAGYIDTLFKRFHPGVRDVLETACGTGNLALQLSRLGYWLVCMDASPDMVKIARGKAHPEAPFPSIPFPRAGGKGSRTVLPPERGKDARRAGRGPLCFLAGSMTALPLTGPFDAVICIYDSINYLTKPRDFRRAAAAAADVLSDGGLFVFDVCTVRNSEMFFRDGTVREEMGALVYERTCRFHAGTRIQENRFVVTRDGRMLGRESHRQKIWYLSEISSMIENAPFREIGRFDDMSFRPGTEESERVHFVLRRLPRGDNNGPLTLSPFPPCRGQGKTHQPAPFSLAKRRKGAL